MSGFANNNNRRFALLSAVTTFAVGQFHFTFFCIRAAAAAANFRNEVLRSSATIRDARLRSLLIVLIDGYFD